MTNSWPAVSVVITTYNAEKMLADCLDSIVKQDYPKERMEIILVDDMSSDKTLEIARKYTETIYTSGKRICEFGRAQGIRNAKYDLILLIDQDNIIPDPDFLKKLVKPFKDNENLVGSFPYKFHYKKDDAGPNRYCSLFGLNDPFQFYSNAREHLRYFEEQWVLRGRSVDMEEYFLVTFSKGDLLTLGAIGFLGKRELMVSEIHGEYFFHADAFNRLIDKGKKQFAAVKTTIIHNHSETTGEFFGKLARNYRNYVKYKDVRGAEIWATKDKLGLCRNIIIMLTLIVPTFHALNGFLKFKDWAWFYHPIYSFGVVAMYSYLTVKFIASNKQNKQ